MRIAMVVNPFTPANLRLANQVGVTDIVARYPGSQSRDVEDVKRQVNEAGMRLAVIEGFLPVREIIYGGPKRDEQIAQITELIRHMGHHGVEILCYNFMAGSGWSRTSFTEPERGGARVSAFDADHVKAPPERPPPGLDQHRLWANLEYFLKRIVPVAEDAGVKLAMHPDDPAVPEYQGFPRIMYHPEAFERLLSLSSSPVNGMCFCQGTFTSMGVDIFPLIERFARHIHFVHFRDVDGTVPRFRETFHDNGPTDMVAAMRAYHRIGFAGPIRPDHVPQLEGEDDGEPGYTMLGRLFAAGYMRGLLQAVTSEPAAAPTGR